MLSKFTNIIKPILRLLEKAFLPLIATIILVDFWNNINKGIVLLLFLYLFLGVLEKLGITFKPIERLKGTKLGKIFARLIRSSNPITQYTEVHLDETSEIIANGIIGTKKQVKKMKEEFKMKKKFVALKLWLLGNKKQLLGNVTLALYILDRIFKFTEEAGVSADLIPYISAFVIAIVFYLMGIEGFTGNVINKLRVDAKIGKTEAGKQLQKAKKEAKKQLKYANSELKSIEKNLKHIEHLGVPVEYQQEYNVFNIRKDKWITIIEDLEEELK